MIYIVGAAEEWLLKLIGRFGNYGIISDCTNLKAGDVVILTNYDVKCDVSGIIRISIVPRLDSIYTERALLPGLLKTALRVVQVIHEGDLIKSLLNLGFTKLRVMAILNPVELRVDPNVNPGSLYTIISQRSSNVLSLMLGRGTGRGTLLIDAVLYNNEIDWGNAYIAGDDLIREVQLLCNAFNIRLQMIPYYTSSLFLI